MTTTKRRPGQVLITKFRFVSGPLAGITYDSVNMPPDRHRCTLVMPGPDGHREFNYMIRKVCKNGVALMQLVRNHG